MDPKNDYTYDYKRFAILYVDDEEKSLRGFSRAFSDQFHIFFLVFIKNIVIKSIPGLVCVLFFYACVVDQFNKGF